MLLVWCLVIVAVSVIHMIVMDIPIIVIRITVCVDAVLRRVQQRGLWLQKPVKLGSRGPRADPHGRHSWRPLTKAWRRSCRHASENAQLSNRLGWRCNWSNNLRLRRRRACVDRFRLWRPMYHVEVHGPWIVGMWPRNETSLACWICALTDPRNNSTNMP